MKLIIAGGRDYQLSEADYGCLDSIVKDHGVTEIVSGGATGVDRCGERFAKLKELPVKVFKADWKTHDKAAGPIRNREMAQYADAVVLFHGGNGTQSMCNEAKKAGIRVIDLRNGMSYRPKF